MTGSGRTAGPGNSARPAGEFDRALRALRAATPRPEVVVAEAPAPSRLAPFAVALTGDVVVDQVELATGRLVLLHDPAGQEAWDGTWRVVAFARAEVEAEMAADPLLPQVGWTWLIEALGARGAVHVQAAGTVTRVVSEPFGTMADRPGEAEIEVRASWTPVWDPGTGPGPAPGVPADRVGTASAAAHLLAWSDLLCAVAGLPELPSGVVPLSRRRDGG